jgi:hypothetical protein
MAIAERNLSLLLASGDAVKVHIDAGLERFADMDGQRPVKNQRRPPLISACG